MVPTLTAAALPAEVAKEAGVTVVPMGLPVDRRAFRDGELDLGEVLATEEPVTTYVSLGLCRMGRDQRPSRRQLSIDPVTTAKLG